MCISTSDTFARFVLYNCGDDDPIGTTPESARQHRSLLLVERLTKDLADDDPDKIAFRTRK